MLIRRDDWKCLHARLQYTITWHDIIMYYFNLLLYSHRSNQSWEYYRHSSFLRLYCGISSLTVPYRTTATAETERPENVVNHRRFQRRRRSFSTTTIDYALNSLLYSPRPWTSPGASVNLWILESKELYNILFHWMILSSISNSP